MVQFDARRWKVLGLTASLGLVLMGGPEAADAQQRTQLRTPLRPSTATATPSQPTALDRLKAATDATGKVKEVDFQPAKIPEAAALVPLQERRVVKSASVVEVAEPQRGFINEEVLQNQIGQRKRELEACRPDRTKAPSSVPLQLRFTIAPGGHTKNTVVMTERRPASLDLVKCVRRRMDAWAFTSPVGGAVDVETTYRFVDARQAREGNGAKKPRAAQRNRGVAVMPAGDTGTAGTVIRAASR